MVPVKPRPLWVPPEQEIIFFKNVFLVSLRSISWAGFVAQLPYPGIGTWLPIKQRKGKCSLPLPFRLCCWATFPAGEAAMTLLGQGIAEPEKQRAEKTGLGRAEAASGAGMDKHVSCKGGGTCWLLPLALQVVLVLGLWAFAGWVLLIPCFPQLLWLGLCWALAGEPLGFPAKS